MAGLDYGHSYTLRGQKAKSHKVTNKRPLYYFDENKKLINKYDSIVEASENLGISHKYLRVLARSRKIYKNKYYFSFDEVYEPRYY